MTDSELAIELASEEPAVVFRRFVAAPPDLVFAVWTEPEHLHNWLAACVSTTADAGSLCDFISHQRPV